MKNQGIQQSYVLDKAILEFLRTHAEPEVLPNNSNVLPLNSYFLQKLPGTSNRVYVRKAVLLKLEEAASQLPPNLCLVVFDAFRSRETQKALFNRILHDIRGKNPHWTETELSSETKKFCSDPEDTDRFQILPHNSGGAIDLAIGDKEGKLPNFGCDFDDPTDLSITDYFEKPFDVTSGMNEETWMEARKNRRMLFHLMRGQGFTNYHHEWWHFDLGDCIWSQLLGVPWIYDSMEPSVSRLEKTIV